MWAAGVVLVLSVAAWVVSLWGPEVRTRGGTSFLLAAGLLAAHPDDNLDATERRVHGFRASLYWWPPGGMDFFGRQGGMWWGCFPLWMPATASGAVLVGLWVVGVHQRRRAMAGHCNRCGYDLSGIIGPCPECGREKEREA